jgi:type IV secretory pathway VirB2 component (pilin)
MTKKITSKTASLFFLAFGFFVPLLSKADTNVDFGEDYASDIGLSDSDPREVVTNLITLFMTFLSIIAVIIILVGGFKWMTAQGNQDKVDEARKIISGGVIGLVIILAAWAIANFVLTTVADQI